MNIEVGRERSARFHGHQARVDGRMIVRGPYAAEITGYSIGWINVRYRYDGFEVAELSDAAAEGAGTSGGSPSRFDRPRFLHSSRSISPL